MLEEADRIILYNTCEESEGEVSGPPSLVSCPSEQSEPDLGVDESASGTIAGEVQGEGSRGAVGCCYADDACACETSGRTVGCCGASTNCEGDHDLTCRSVDYSGYPNNWNMPWPGYTPLSFGLYSLGRVHEQSEGETSSSESEEIFLLSSHRPIVTYGDSPVQRPRYLQGKLKISVGEMEVLVLNSEGEYFS